MNKKIIYLALLFFVSAIFSCSESGEEPIVEEGESSVQFVKTEISISGKAGQRSVILAWENVEWEIETSGGESFISNISPLTGGQKGKSGYTTIYFNVSENILLDERLDELFVVNKASGKKVKLQITQETLPFVTVNAAAKHQEVVGFGGMYNPAIWLSADNRIDASELATMYAPDGDLQYSILRLMIYPDKTKWETDVAGALQALEYGAIVFACPWDCTDALADYIDKDGDGDSDKHLPEKNYEAYADHLIEYIQFMKSKGVDIYSISVQNEPDMHFTYWTPQEVANFTASYGAKIRATGVKLMTPEACGFSPDYTNAILNSAEAFANTDIVAGHTYQGFTNLSSNYVKGRHDYVESLYASHLKPAGKGGWWMTEKLFGSYGYDLESGDYKTWAYNFDKLGLEMHMCMEAYCSAYLYWYLKRFYGMIGDNNTEHGYVAEGEVMKNGYIMAHYSAYATGTTRIDIDVPNENVLATAYLNETENEISIVALNRGDSAFETFVELPEKVTAHKAVETTQHYNMKTVETELSNEQKHVKISISPQSIYSLKVRF
ncbi:hypothetical protein [uncultured Draconibacterium sp.]|uniref:hypothetical protein n=1 Tax=uncultured Draconibacterium sp. TaxID=1573823 RepID=UPI0025EF2D80|nr:hypothetical protein [uncultured Draconibacterium sp.]